MAELAAVPRSGGDAGRDGAARAEARPDRHTSEPLAGADLPLVSVIMPAYNEELVLGANLERTYRYLEAQGARYEFELIVVNDGSSDGTGAIADRFAQDRHGVRVVHHAVNGHLGRALRTGFRESRGDYVVTLDSDLTYGPEHLNRLLEALVEHRAHVAVASAYMRGGRVSGVPAGRLLLSRAANRYLSTAVHGRLHTLTCMVRAYDGELVRNLSLRCSATDINTEILYKADVLGARIVEIPAHLDWASATRAAPGRVSSMKVARSTGQYLRAGLLFRPGAPLSAVARCSGLAAALFTVALITLGVRAGLQTDGNVARQMIAGMETAAHDHPAVAVLALALLIVSLQLAGLAFLARQARRHFEELFDLTSRATWHSHDSQLWDATTTVPAAVDVELSAAPMGPVAVASTSATRA